MKVYISGPMTGKEKLNLPAFLEAKALVEANGDCAIIPHEITSFEEMRALENKGLTYREIWQFCLRRDLIVLLQCDAIWVIDGWFDSEGAREEKHTADVCGIPMWFPKKRIEIVP
jgi:hypothetical protein